MRIRTRAFTLAVAVFASAATLAPSVSHAAANLIPNPGFEVSVLPSAVVAAASNQPVLPQGWIAEGATVLFDHTPHFPHSGEYAAAISGSLSGPRHDCSVQCTDVPGGSQRDMVEGEAYSPAPAWRNALPIAVSGGRSYQFSAWMRLSIPKDGTGAVTRVRWLDANNVPIGWSAGPKLISPSDGGASYATFVEGANAALGGHFVDHSTQWTYESATVTAPSGAAGAIVLLGYSDDVWNGQVVYDDVCLAPTSAAAC